VSFTFCCALIFVDTYAHTCCLNYKSFQFSIYTYYSENSDNGEELKEAYKTLYIEYEKLREDRKQHLYDMNSLQTEKSSLLLRIQELEEKLLETQLQLERVTDEKLTRMLSIQKTPTDKTDLMYVAPSSDAPSTSKTVFVKPTVLEPPPTVEDKGNEKLNGLLILTSVCKVCNKNINAKSKQHKYFC
jgi:hypothetical protein